MALIQISNLTFAYEGSYDNIFENVSFSIDTSWRLGFVGRNGRGKTTFLRLLCGALDAGGAIACPAGLRFNYFPPAVPDESLTARAVAESLVPDLEAWRLERELSLLDFDAAALDRAFMTLSGGERVKLLLASQFLDDGHFLLIDEPTDHLDLAARQVVRRYLGGKRGFILVSHDRAFLDDCVDHTLAINRRNIEIERGNFSSWWENKERRDRFERDENERLTADIRRLNQTARRAAGWADAVEASKYGNGPVDRGYIGAKSAKMMKRAKAAENRALTAAEEKSKLLKNVESRETLKIHPLRHRSAKLFELHDLSIFYDGVAAAENISFTVENGQRIALRGRNGSGKSSILKLLCGQPLTHTGTLLRASGLVISHVAQETAGLHGGLTDYARDAGIDETLFKTILRKMDFSRPQLEKDINSYSYGQKKKVLLAASLATEAHLYIWDEPLNYVDLLSRIQIEELILEYQPTMIFVEHDDAFCDRVATRIIDLDCR